MKFAMCSTGFLMPMSRICHPQKVRKLKLADHQRQPDIHRHDTGMGCHLFDHLPRAAALRKAGDSRRPHDDALRHQINGRIYQPLGAEHPLRIGIPHKSRIGYQMAYWKTFFRPVSSLLYKIRLKTMHST